MVQLSNGLVIKSITLWTNLWINERIESQPLSFYFYNQMNLIN